ncbi:RagB/SusD family nutrient uptake outer membrane protein [Pseudoflavitalea rhizosphaerae]|uniref:RagB/SusD family nutrient uptake outer membrane protein n=1 Tax=Pseudoflavitalea rhizosphaerae TaxID=1884793 RepID=UPI000F8EB977|nr:RagB/SusD family nutrient uptake outer membrane protein [Pseudoflavitalea rhizosphaerae]
MKRFTIVALLAMLAGSGCKKYLDIVPDNIATIDYAFRARNVAEKYLFTCYSYMPDDASIFANPGMLTADEFWFYYPGFNSNAWNIARGLQNKVNPYLNYWGGLNTGKPLFQALRDCNIFLENINKVPDMDQMEKDRWSGEVKFLKAYYHYFLFRLYGPVPLIKTNIPISASVEEVKVKRMPVDSCVDYVIQLLDESIPVLPDIIQNEASELGRITKTIAMTLKADVLVTAASPLFNGNPDYASFKDNDEVNLFPATYSQEKWAKAAAACKAAIDQAHGAGHYIFKYINANPSHIMSDWTKTQMSIRNAVTQRWNKEIIWANSQSQAIAIQRYAFIRALDPAANNNSTALGDLAPTLKMAETFYTENGVPISEDKTWDYQNRYGLRVSEEEDKHAIKMGYTTAKLNYDREPRFYADLGFDGGTWYGHGRFDDNNPWVAEMKLGQTAARKNTYGYSITGYQPKKLVFFTNTATASSYPIESYPWPIYRLADLYLLYAEALNESEGPTQEVYDYVNLVRERASIPTVQDAWTTYSTQPDKFTNKSGMREIIHQERMIELAFEGKRAYDLRRWKKAMSFQNTPVEGWDILQSETVPYYQKKILFPQKFQTRDYLWPIRENDITVNRKLVQNPGW